MAVQYPAPTELADLLAEAHAYVQLRAALGLRPDPLCPRMIALRDALNLLPAIDREEEQRMRLIVARSERNRALLRIVTGPEQSAADSMVSASVSAATADAEAAYDETDRHAWLGEFPK